MQIKTEIDKCIGSGSCEMIAPDYFTVGDDGLVKLLKDTVAAGDEGTVQTAAVSCPTQVISLEQ